MRRRRPTTHAPKPAAVAGLAPKGPQLPLFSAELIALLKPANRQERRCCPRARKPRPHDCHSHAAVEAELRGQMLVELKDLEGIAQELHDRSPLTHPFESPVYLAAGAGYAVDAVEGAECGRGGLHPFILEVRPSADIHRWNLRVLHELAHALLRKWREAREGRKYTHADVWALALMLACPSRSFRDVDLAHHVPAWALKLRGQLARVVARAA